MALVCLSLLTTGWVTPVAPAAAKSAPLPFEPPLVEKCADLLLITVRGSGETLGNSKVNAMETQFKNTIGTQRTIETEQLWYPAEPMSTLGADVADAFSTSGSDWEYFESVNSGWLQLADKLGTAAISCPNQKWALFGYSQGALVISQAVANYADPKKYAGVVLLANPARIPADAQVNLGSATAGKGLISAFGLAYTAYPASLSAVTTDFCDSTDLVCDTVRLLGSWLGTIFDTGPTPTLTAAIDQGAAIHSAYTADRISAAVTKVTTRALAMTIPVQSTVTKTVCSVGGYFQGTLWVKPLNPTGVNAERWRLRKPYAPTGATVYDAGFTFPDGREFGIADDGSYAGKLAAGTYEIPLRVYSLAGTERPVTLRIIVASGTACGGIEGTVTGLSLYSDLGRLKGITVNLYSLITDTYGARTQKLRRTQLTDGNGYYGFGGLPAGQYVLYFDDGSIAGTGGEAVDYFDQYYTSWPTRNDSDRLTNAKAFTVESSGQMLKVDQELERAFKVSIFFYDKVTGRPVQGVSVSDHDTWRAESGADGWATSPARVSFDRKCMSMYDFQNRYVERADFYGWWFGSGIAMYPASSISGTVTDTAGKPIAGAMVYMSRNDPAGTDWGGGFGCMENLGQRESDWTLTSSTGTYSFPGLFGGDGYTLTASAEGYEASTLPVFSVKGENNGGASASKSFTLAPNPPAQPKSVTAAAVTFLDKDGTAQDSYTIPKVEGVDYFIGSIITSPGMYPGVGTVTVVAKARPGFVLASGSTSQWSTTFKSGPIEVVPAPVIFADRDGTSQDTYTIPSTTGVDYLIGLTVKAAGTYPGAGTISITAKARPGYRLASDAPAQWSTTFTNQSKRSVDFSGDSKVDVMSRDGAGGLWLYPGNGTGGWLTPRQIGTGWNTMTTILGPGD
ncbi:carboxypeptidase regulatory-like domain-containing protein, partial [Paenarthrobacter sp. NPDC092416]|uniref:carboxypeptidase regulatory-like domain-containing protein n=1 Tax=Paenarthrobacter sp. NPDC092416 TaxID=3364386 RepID=UPI0037FEFE24